MSTKLRSMLEAGAHPIIFSLHTPDSLLTETVGRIGFDAVLIDMQHGAFAFDGLYDMLVSLAASDTSTLVRVPWNDPAVVMKVLDAGADGVAAPLIDNRAEAEKFVGACRYAPDGYRSIGPFRAGLQQDYVKTANQAVLTVAQIETGQAFDNLDEIASTPGLDALFPGPGDLTMSMGGKPGINYSDAALAQRLQKIIEVARANGKWVMLPEAGNGRVTLDWGADSFIVNDMQLYTSALRGDLASARMTVQQFEQTVASGSPA